MISKIVSTNGNDEWSAMGVHVNEKFLHWKSGYLIIATSRTLYEAEKNPYEFDSKETNHYKKPPKKKKKIVIFRRCK